MPLFYFLFKGRPPTFISNHYYCESGNNIETIDRSVSYTNDPLWDGAGCQPGNTCCIHAGMPWFFRQFPVNVNDIEVRICKDNIFTDEDVTLEQLELCMQ